MAVIEQGKKFGSIAAEINTKLDYTVPVGTVLPYVGNSAPDGWLLCDGRSYSRSRYAELAALIGGNAETFTVPNLNSGKYLKGGSGFSERSGTLHTNSAMKRYASGTSFNDGSDVYSDTLSVVELPHVSLTFIIKY